MCVGDFNINMLEVFSNPVTNLNSLLDSVGLKQLIDIPTRTTNNSATLIDLILVSRDLVIKSDGVIPMPELSDHDLIFCDFTVANFKKTMPCIKEYRDFKNFNYNQFSEDLKSVPWKNIYDISEINGKIDFLNENLNILLDLHAPKKVSRFTRQNKPWITENVKELINLREKSLARFKKTKNNAHWEYYKELRNLTTNTIRLEKKAFLETKLRGSKNVWKDLQNLNIGKNKSVPDIPNHLSNPDEINNFFISSVPQVQCDNRELINSYQNNIHEAVHSVLTFNKVSEMEVYKVISSIKSCAKGIDGFNIQILQLCCPFLLPFLTHIINFCIENSVYPDAWKKGLIMPLPKINNPKEYKDLRPISVLSCMSKVLEKIINMQLREHTEQNHILPDTQSGFRENHGCSTALANVTDNIMQANDLGKITVLTLIDFSKAFDTINHEVLLSILHFIGLSDEAVKFFANYLSNRSQSVKINNKLSQFLNVSSGTPQGSILSPLLYAIYTSSFSKTFKYCSAQYYADDTQIYFSFDKTEVVESCNIINRELKELKNTAQKHSLYLNPNKCCIMLFGRSTDIANYKESIKINIDDVALPIKNNVKNLGVIVDSSLRFTEHISYCVQRAFVRLKLLYSNRHILNKKLKIMLCDSLILSVFNHGDVVYGNCLTNIEKRRIQLMQNSCLRLIYGIKKYERISHKLKESNWLNMQNRRQLHSACFYHKIITLKSPPYLYNKIIFRSHVHNINVRFRGAITPPFHRTTLYERSFSYNIARIYNSIPCQIKALPISAFKKKYKMYLLNSQT